MERWQKLFYCGRCDVVFVPGESAFFPVEKLNEALS
jgi:hypothetical protein